MRPIATSRPMLLAICLAAACPPMAQAGLTSSTLAQVGVSPPHDARVPLQTSWRDERGSSITLGAAMAGRPAVLVFADFTCRTLCGPTLAMASDALARAAIAQTDYRLVVLGLDPRDGPDQAAALRRGRIGDDVAAVLLTSDEATVRQVADSLGYRFAYDPEQDQFAHPAAVMVLTADGRLSRMLDGIAIDADDLRLALVEAGGGRTASLGDRIRLACYGFDPVKGTYTVSILRVLAIGAAFTIFALATAIACLTLWPRRAS